MISDERLANWDPRLTIDAWPYLQIQCGSVQTGKGEDSKTLWGINYKHHLVSRFKIIRQFLPESCERNLDVGGGMGGINILLNKCYPRLTTTIIDGVDDEPELELHRIPTNHAGVGAAFLAKNDHPRVHYLSPMEATAYAMRHAASWERYDLVTSFGSWCFHYAPSAYIDYVDARTEPGARLIIEVRHEKHDWLKQLCERFDHVGMIHRTKKWDCHVFTRR